MKHIQQTIDSHNTTPKEVETALSELENIAVQCQTRKLEGADDEETNLKSNTFILDRETHKPMSILLLVADILQKIVILKKAIETRRVTRLTLTPSGMSLNRLNRGLLTGFRWSCPKFRRSVSERATLNHLRMLPVLWQSF